METPSAWSTTTAGAVLGQSSVHSQGSYSLSLRPSNGNGFTPIKSVPLTTLAAVSPTLAVDVMLPAYQPNPWWYGTAQAYIDCPSRGIWSQFLNQVELTGKPLGVWNTVNFTLTNSHIAGLLQAGYSDLTITVVVNVQVPTTGIYLVDNLRFVPVAANGCGGRPNGTSCTDNSACTLGDTCQFGTCRSGTAVTCTASDQCHDAGVCNPATGVCSNPSKPNGTSCNDGNACTQTDTCQGGACTGGNPVACVASDQCHDVGVCDPATGTCSNPAKADGTVCDDGDACMQTDLCINGVCMGSNPVVCPAADQCHVGVCDSGTGSCSNMPLTGTTCDDGNGCTTEDTCEDGTCIGSGSGYVGPGEQCAPATPTTPGPFGDFHCLLEEVRGTTKNVLRLGSGASTEAWILRGSMDFSFTQGEARLTKLSATGQQSRLSQQGGIVLALDRNSPSSGSVDEPTGDVQMTLPVLVIRPGEGQTSLSLSFVGQIADRVLQGSAASAGSTVAQVQVFCREQFMNTVASATFELDLQGNFLAQGPVDIFGGTPTMPGIRSLPGSEDVVAELVSVTGEILDQYSIGQPWTARFPNLPLPPPPPEPPATVDVTIRAPLSNRLGGVILRTSMGVALAMSDLMQSIDSFCAGDGSQYCDYRAAIPVRPVVYAASIKPRILGMPRPTSDNENQRLPLISSPRLVDDPPRSATETLPDSHPAVALDTDGNAVVVWRDGSDVLARGIARDGTEDFPTRKVNDPSCLPFPWLPELVVPLTQARPRVARAADGRFVVGWSGLSVIGDLPDVFPYGFVCARVMNPDGTPATDPIWVVPANDSYVGWEFGYFDLAMTDSGSFMVAWASADGSKVFAQGFSPNGDPKLVSGNPPASNPLVVASAASATLGWPTVAMDASGNAVVAWHKGNVYAQEDVAMLQRLNPDMGKRGSAIQIPSLPGGGVPDGVPDVAMTRDGSRIVIAGRSTSHDIWASAYEFAGGNAALPTFRVNARQGGSQRKPIVASLDSGEFLVAWLDDVGVDTRTASVIAAQVFDSDGYPRDVDFTVTTDEPIASQIPDPPLDFDQFPFDVASSGNDYVAAWRVSGGIKLQWIKGRKASVECPLTTGCGTAVPLRITGPTQEKIDVILSPGQVVRDDTGVLLPDFAPPYPSNTPEFARKAVDLIVNGYLASNLFASHIDQFNFYYDMSQGIRRMIYDQYGCRLTGETASGRNEINEVLGFSGNKSFVDVAGVIFKSYKAWVDGCYLEEPGLAYMREGSKTDDMNIRSGAWSSFWIRDSSDYSTFLHESGHAVFGLREEYCSIGAKEDTHYHSNTFADLNSCSDNTAHTDTSDCREIGNCDGISKADADTCPMIGGGGMQFDADCLKRAQCMIDGLTHEECP